MVARKGGASLHTVLVIVALLTVVATTMVALYMFSLNFTQAFCNEEAARVEAETAVSELLSRLADDAGYGTRGEEIRGRVTPDANPDEAYHVLTFQADAEYPHSTNALTGTCSGSLGRTVPGGTVHAVATGFCRGRYCTVEAIIEHPPYPYGLATSGAIRSASPLEVRGTREASAWPDKEDRPGHIVSNSLEGIDIGPPPPNSPPELRTYISGYVRSVGPITVAEPSEIRGGARPYAPPIPLPVIDPTTFSNRGQPGVVDIIDSSFPAQRLDVMYYCGHDLEYTGPVEMRNAFLFVDGNLTIHGGVRGVGAIVNTGDLFLKGGSTLEGTNRLALLSGGKAVIRGNDNYFVGVVYARRGLDARNITVLGNAIASNPDDPQQGSADLDHVRVVSTETASSLRFTATSSTQAQSQLGTGKLPFLIGSGAGEFPTGKPGDLEIAFEVPENAALYDVSNAYDQKMQGFFQELWAGGKKAAFNPGAPVADDAGPLLAQWTECLQQAQQAAEVKEAIDASTPLPADDPDTPGDESAEAAAELAALQEQLSQLQAAFQSQSQAAALAYQLYVVSHAQADGLYNSGGAAMDISREYTIDINSYLPASELHRITYWHATFRRL